MNSRERFEAWVSAMATTTIGGINAWSAWQAGRLAGQKDMRERAAKEVNLETGMRHMSEKIRNLPVEE